MPSGSSYPQIWLLGSSNYSSSLASHLGLRFAFAHFISSNGGEEASQAYRQHFKKSNLEKKPYSMVCVSVICAKTTKEAEILAGPLDNRRLLMSLGRESQIQTTANAQQNRYSEREKMVIEESRGRSIIGCPKYVKDELQKLRERFSADELMIVTITGDYKNRLNSYELIADSFAF